MRRSLNLFVLALVVVCLAASADAQGNNPPPSSIQVFVPNGGTLPRSVRLELARDDGGQHDTLFTDSKGLFQIATPRTGMVRYTVTIVGDELTFATTVFNFTLYGGTAGQTQIFLRPITNEKRSPNAVLDVASLESSVPSKARSAYKLAMDAVSERQYDEAIRNLNQAISAYPDYVRAINDLGVVYLKLNRLDEAAAAFKKAIAINNRFFYSRMNLGIVLTKQGKYKEAAGILGKLCDENRGMLEVRLAYAKALDGAGDLVEAEKVYRSILESKALSQETRADVQFYLGVILNRAGRYADARTELEKGLMIDEDANLHLQLGAALMQLQQLPRAEEELLRAYEMGGRAAGAAQFLLGNIYYSEKKFAEAQRCFEQFLKDVPTAPNAPEINRLIADLKAAPRN
jgi:tetratricopeptide (TPR) repeat protein